MLAHVGDWLVVPTDPGETHVHRGQVVAVPHPDGSPPYRVRRLDDDHESLLFPPPGTRRQCPASGRDRRAPVS
jgi:hypothetical protein